MTTRGGLIIAKKFVKKVTDSGIPISEAIVFGSYAKETAKKWSDIDLCLVSPTFRSDRHSERVRLMKLRDKETGLIEPHPFDPESFKDRYNFFAEEIRKTGIRI